MTELSDVEGELRTRGLEPRGAFHPTDQDGVATLPDGRPAGTLVLAGNLGASMWEQFSRERRDEPDPLDRWATRGLAAVAARFGATVVLPTAGPPRPPFQRWAARAGPVHPSPLGLLIHPEFGLWHAYRGALVLAERLSLPSIATGPSPCDSCSERPCLAACPVAAFRDPGYDDGACAAHLGSGSAELCFASGCLARAACPVGAGHRYAPEQARFHLRAFLRNRARFS